MNMQNFANGNNLFPITTNIDNNSDMKLPEDKYVVFVNGNFVGHKYLKFQGETLSDIDDFVRSQGLSDFFTTLDGAHYTFQSDNQDTDITTALSVYFNNR